MDVGTEPLAEPDAEQVISEIYGELLGRETVGRDEDFFDLGGHSRTVVQLVARLEERTGSRLSVRDVFESSTVAQLAPLLRQRIAEDADKSNDS